MRNYVNSKYISGQVKAGLQACHKSINKEKHFEREFRLFSSLATFYLQKENIRKYTKAVAIYQYLKKLTEAHLNGDKEKLTLLDQRIKVVEARFLEKVKVLKNDINGKEQEGDEEQGITDINVYREQLVRFREEIKKELVAIEDLGIEKDKEELNEKGLQKRAQEVERIYMSIREFFIGKGDKEGELAGQGLVNKLISDCIRQLGGLPKVGKDKHKVEYAIFGMGSLALGTMTPWSDLEFGILIEDGLTLEDENRVKEYFRNLTSLLHIKVINFGESPLRMMGIPELNNFKLTEKSNAEHNWFYDNLTSSGFSFDGPHWHACKTPLGREKGYKRFIEKKVVECGSYELIGTINEVSSFCQDATWVQADSQLVQGLGHIVLINGSNQLMISYRKKLNEYLEPRKKLAFKLLKDDSQGLDPFKQVWDDDKEGQILKVKKEIYRFPDRVIVALGDCLSSQGLSSWELVNHLRNVEDRLKKNLRLALSIAVEVRLRVYDHNKSQKEDMSALAKYESQIKELDNTLSEIFCLKNMKILFKYYYIVIDFYLKITKIEANEQIIEINNIGVISTESILIRGLVYHRFLKYYEAIYELESIDYYKDPYVTYTLAKLYHTVGRNEEAMRLYKLLYNQGVYDQDIAAALNNIGTTLQSLGKYEEALKRKQESIEIYQSIHKKNDIHVNIADLLNNVGITLQSLGKYEEALKHHQDCLRIRRKLYIGDHQDVAMSLNNICVALGSLGSHDKVLEYQQESLGIISRIYRGDHINVARVLNSMAIALRNINKFTDAIKYHRVSLEMRKRIYKGDHQEIARSLDSIGFTLCSFEKYQEALTYHNDSLAMMYRIYNEDHSDIAAVLNNIGRVNRSLGRYNEALEVYKKSLYMLQNKIYKEDHAEIAIVLYNIGYTLHSLGKYKDALKYKIDSLEMRQRVYQRDHIDIADSLNSIGNTLQKLGKPNEDALGFYRSSLEIRCRLGVGDKIDTAIVLDNIGYLLQKLKNNLESLDAYRKSIEIRKAYYKNGHVDIAISLNNMAVILEELGNYDEAINCLEESIKIMRGLQYEDVNISALINLKGLLESLVGHYNSNNNVDLAIRYQEKLSAIFLTERGVIHNLACSYHIKAIVAKFQGHAQEFQVYHNKARTTFARALRLKSPEVVQANLYVEYAMFSLVHHDNKNKAEYSLITANAMLAIGLKEDGSGLSYGQIEKATTVEPIQKLLNNRDEVVVKPYLLAYYLLIKVHCFHNNIERAEEALKEFSFQKELLKGTEDEEMAQYLLDWSNKEVEREERSQEQVGGDEKGDNDNKSSKDLELAATVIQRSWRKYIEARRVANSDKDIQRNI